MRSSSLACLAAVPLLAACGGEDRQTSPAAEQQDAMPRDGDEALEWLLEGNERFIAGRPQHPNEELHRRARLGKGQRPFAAVLGCSDSRVPPELIFDYGLGDLFVIRVAGNVVADDEAGSLEYAADHLEVPLVLVLGHEGCGAVTAAFGTKRGEGAELVRLLARLEPGLAEIDPALPLEERVRLGVEANVRNSVEQLRAIAERDFEEVAPELRIVGAIYELETGRVRVLD
ncbi:MAG: carbonic anhydrase [Myxococcota bacterium]|nr:carbonic anhydrase [Myxococcota bacterium]